MHSPLLSIFIPTYNRSEILARLLLLLNDWVNNNPMLAKDIEIVISDNASTDNTKEICNLYCSKSECFQYFCNENNIGPIDNFMKAPVLCNGEFIWLFGDDDIMMCQYISNLLEVLSDSNVNFLFLSILQESTLSSSVYKLSKLELFKKFPLTELGRISRLVFKKSFLDSQIYNYAKRPSYAIWTMIIPIVNIDASDVVCIIDLPFLYATKDGGNATWRFKVALPRLAEFIEYCSKVTTQRTDLLCLLDLNFDNRKKIAKDYLAASIINPKEKKAFSIIELLLYEKNLKNNPYILIGKFFQSNFGSHFARLLKGYFVK